MAIEDYYGPLTTQRAVKSKNVISGTNKVWSNNLVNIQGLINISSSNLIFIIGQHQVQSTHKLFTAIGQDIKTDDRIIDANDNIYRIVSDPQDTVQRGHHWLIYLQRIETDGKI